jgi:hypothetical protein
MITLPTIHNNGTGRQMLTEGYDNAADKLQDFIEAWGKVEFNARDYYVQGPDAWVKALEEREAMSAKIREVRDYITEIRQHLYDA